MSPVWVAFAWGLFLGVLGGIAVIALCVAAKSGDSVTPSQQRRRDGD